MHQRSSRIDLEGDLDISRVRDISETLSRAIDADRVVINCMDVSSMDSSILSALMRFRREFIGFGKSAHEIVVIVNPKLRRLFEITGLVKTLTVVTSDADHTPA